MSAMVATTPSSSLATTARIQFWPSRLDHISQNLEKPEARIHPDDIRFEMFIIHFTAFRNHSL